MEKRLPLVALLRKGEGALLLGLLWTISMVVLLQMVSMAGLSGMIKSGVIVAGVLLGVASASWVSSSILFSQYASIMPIGVAVVRVPQLLQLAPGSPR